MGAQVRYGTIAVGAYMAHQPGTHQFAFTDQYLPWWNRGGARALKTRCDPMVWYGRWSFGCKVGFGMPAGNDGAAPVGGDMVLSDPFTPFEIQDGSQSLKWIKGVCVDTSDVPVSGANVVAFRTSDNTPGGSAVQSREDGSYDAPTPYVGVDHYVRAYIDGSPDRGGTTLDTLTPTNIDGT